jgi:hypothetical protein
MVLDDWALWQVPLILAKKITFSTFKVPRFQGHKVPGFEVPRFEVPTFPGFLVPRFQVMTGTLRTLEP